MKSCLAKVLGFCLCVCLIISMTFFAVTKVDAYYGSNLYGSYPYGSSYYGGYGLYGSTYGGYGLYGSGYGLYGGYSGLYGSMYGLYGGMYGGLGLYGGMLGLYGGMYGGMLGLYGGMYGMSSLYSPFSVSNLYYPIETTGGLTYQVPFMQIAPLLGVSGLYNQLFPSLFNPATVTTTTAITAPVTGTSII